MGFAPMVSNAERYAKVTQALEQAVPGWLNSKVLEFEISSEETLLLRVTRSQLRMVRQILPTLRSALRPHAISTVRLSAKTRA